MTAYNIRVAVRFDPCALQNHDFRPETFGLAALAQIEKCDRCGALRYPRFDIGGIDRSPSAWGHA
jgi:hypothetical protein